MTRIIAGMAVLMAGATAAVADEPAGFAVFFQTFSTFLGVPGMYLEDLYVIPRFRRHGLGRMLLTHLATIARERGYGRVE